MGSSSVRDAATVIITRPGAAALEVLLVKRHRASGFMAGAFVFPGGKVDPADRSGTPRSPLDPTPGRALSAEEEAAVWNAACRETSEEAGLRVAADDLVYWAHWITPSAEPKRFDTHFFVAEVPADQTPAIDHH